MNKNVITKMYAESDKVELSEVKVEMAISDKLKTELKNYSALISKYGNTLNDYYSPIRQIEKLINEVKGYVSDATKIAQDLRKQEDIVSSELDIVTKKIKQAKDDLGINIDINDVVDLSSLESSNKLSSEIQSDADLFIKYSNSLPNLRAIK